MGARWIVYSHTLSWATAKILDVGDVGDAEGNRVGSVKRTFHWLNGSNLFAIRFIKPPHRVSCK